MRRNWFVANIRILAVLAAAAATASAAAATAAISRRHLDAGRVQFSGMDISGDGIVDAIHLDRVKQALFYFVGDKKGNFRPFDPATLPEEDRRFVPDVLVERDLDGDQIDDLLLYNRAYLEKYASSEQSLLRILAGSLYIGQPGGLYQSLPRAALSEEARKATLERARKVVFPGP